MHDIVIVGGGLVGSSLAIALDGSGLRVALVEAALPQVAAQANWQWQVSKRAQDGQLRSRVVALDDAARVEEIARMLGGVEITPITRQHASEMLGAS